MIRGGFRLKSNLKDELKRYSEASKDIRKRRLESLVISLIIGLIVIVVFLLYYVYLTVVEYR